MARRTRSPHPGVVLNKRVWTRPDGTKAAVWRLKFRDPDSGAWVFETPERATSKAGATAAAREKSVALAKRQGQLAAGGTRETGRTVREVMGRYLDGLANEARAATVAQYRPNVERFVAWCEAKGVESTDDLRPEHVAAFRASLAGLQRASGSDKRLSPATVNSYMRPVRAALFALRKARELPHLNDQDLGDTLEAVKEPRSKKPHLGAGEVLAILQACLVHDAERCKITRAEHDGERPIGSTPRYSAIAPFVAFCLLTGCRVNEAVSLRWVDVDLDAPDDQGRPVGSIRMRAENVKTGAERQVGLEVSPGLRSILQAMKARAGDEPRVFGALTFDAARAALRRLLWRCGGCAKAGRSSCSKMIDTPQGKRLCLGAPAFGWQKLRRTCGTFLVCSPGIFGAGAVWLAAQQLGHSVQVAEKSYLGRVRGIKPNLRTLDAVLGLGKVLTKIAAGRGAGRGAQPAAAVGA